MEFPIEARTKDGLKIQTTLSFSYVLITDLKILIKLFFTMGDPNQSLQNKYETYFKRISRNTVRDTFGKFVAWSLFKNRKEVSDLMKSDLTTDLQQ